MATETRDVSEFTGVDLAGEGRVEIRLGDAESLSIAAEDNLMSLLTSEVRDGVLVLGSKRSIDPTKDIVYTVTMKTVDRLEVSGSGQINAPAVESHDITAAVSGSGEVRWSEVSAANAEVDISGSGHVVLSGEADHIVISISGSGDLEADDLMTVTADIDVSGSGHVVVSVAETLVADVSGSGSIEYLGDPQVESHMSGSGSIKPR